MSKTDNQLKEDIEQELRWDPKVNAAQIGVSVDKGVVTLLGAVDTYPEKWAAEDATKRVCGVRTVAQDLTVKLLSDHVRTDSDIAAATQSALKWDVYVPNSVTAKVHQGAITLEGQVTWNFQREAASRAVCYLAGVVSVFNAITLKPQTSASQVKDKVVARELDNIRVKGKNKPVLIYELVDVLDGLEPPVAVGAGNGSKAGA